MATCTELYIDTLGGLNLDGSTDKNLPYFVVENLASLPGCSAGADNAEVVLYATVVATSVVAVALAVTCAPKNK